MAYNIAIILPCNTAVILPCKTIVMLLYKIVVLLLNNICIHCFVLSQTVVYGKNSMHIGRSKLDLVVASINPLIFLISKVKWQVLTVRESHKCKYTYLKYFD